MIKELKAEKKGIIFYKCLNQSKIEFEQIIYKRKVWVFKNITSEKIKYLNLYGKKTKKKNTKQIRKYQFMILQIPRRKKHPKMQNIKLFSINQTNENSNIPKKFQGFNKFQNLRRFSFKG